MTDLIRVETFGMPRCGELQSVLEEHHLADHVITVKMVPELGDDGEVMSYRAECSCSWGRNPPHFYTHRNWMMAGLKGHWDDIESGWNNVQTN